jgi:hypothetical protein
MDTLIDYITNIRPCNLVIDSFDKPINIATKSVVITTCLHNPGLLFKPFIENIQLLASEFRQYKLLIYLNHSTDKTHELVKKLCSKDPNIIVVGSSNKMNNAYCRNVLLHLVKIHYSHFNYYMVIDCNEYTAQKLNIDAFKLCFKTSTNWGMITPVSKCLNVSSLRGYSLNYDYHDYMHHIVHELKQPLTSKLKYLLCEQHETIMNGINEHQLINVVSAFNHMAIYKMEYIRGCLYDNVSRWCTFHNQPCNKMCIQHVNEHVAFHQQMITLNKSANYIIPAFSI